MRHTARFSLFALFLLIALLLAACGRAETHPGTQRAEAATRGVFPIWVARLWSSPTMLTFPPSNSFKATLIPALTLI